MPRPVYPLSPIQIQASPTSLSSSTGSSPFSTYSWDNPTLVSPSAAPGARTLGIFKFPSPSKRRRFTLRLRNKKVVPCGAYDSNDSYASYADSVDSRIRWRTCTPPPSPLTRYKQDHEAFEAEKFRWRWGCRLLSGGCIAAIILLLT
jgi:hypothetical protein